MPKATQLNVKLENKPGSLARLCRDLANHGINLLALSAPDITAKRGLIRLLVVNPELAQLKVTKMEYSFTVEEVLYIEIKNRPGSLAKAMEKLARAGINVRYAYATALRKTQKTGAVIAVAEEDLPRAHKLLG
ncbi:MAG: ACT domain-containing protein [Candidatus Latescibacteria bacterium]|nr:ACT domain-containing protein [Candidatus Latescibacterota bacterium]NIO57439.1 ACT domain-containing protein [Candidatus Latescibacterota bacterium]